jgi:DNA sulfur modification protein DndC
MLADMLGDGVNLRFGDRPLSEYIKEIQDIYLADDRPWVVGFSGGKDSTVCTQLVYQALLDLSESDRKKSVFIVSSDTLVETPLVIDLIKDVLKRIELSAIKHKLPLSTAQVSPEITDSYWVNLLGKGYPAPTKQFRWCTERMKIDPVSQFIQSKVAKYGEVIVILGSRLAESATRAQVIRKHKIEGNRLASHTSLPSAYVYTPIENWSTEDVWEYLFSVTTPWGGNHQQLLDLYRGSNAGECPLVVDTGTPSCGHSRFGCWVCTVVTEDKAISGLIQTGEKWLQPLLDFRDLLSETTKPENKTKFRNHKRRTGRVHAARDGTGHIPGPYWMSFRQELLRRLLRMQKSYNDQGNNIELISRAELQEIRKHWIQDPNEPDWEDALPRIYREVVGEDLDWAESDAGAFTKPDAELLGELGKTHGVAGELVMKLLELELSMDGLSKRSGIFGRIDEIMKQEWGALAEALKQQKDTDNRASTYDEREKELLSLYDSLRQ